MRKGRDLHFIVDTTTILLSTLFTHYISCYKNLALYGKSVCQLNNEFHMYIVNTVLVTGNKIYISCHVTLKRYYIAA